MEWTVVKLLLCFSVLTSPHHAERLVNVARGKSYKQSSYWAHQSFSVSNAANGDKRGVYSANNCIHTGSGDYNPWWEVDLGRIYPVYNITIYGRTTQPHRLNNTKITVDGVECHSIRSVRREHSFTCYQVVYGRKVRITRSPVLLPKPDPYLDRYLLNMCEFEVLVPAGVSNCSAGFWGTTCDVECNKDCGGGPGKNFCYQDSGDCYGCIAGYHGSNCSELCDARCKDSVCDQDSGSCLHCARGFYGGTCNQSCSPGCPNSECDQRTGHCQPCDSSYWGDSCDQRCPSRCSICTQETGRCLSCEYGYWGDVCNETCLSSRCKDNQCNQENGLCLTCPGPYFQLPYCECKDGRYYSNPYCIECPGKCFNNTPCNKTTGHCDSCPPGKRGNICSKDCAAGTYGSDCAEECGHCFSNSTCNTVTGQCLEGCDDGWRGRLCQEHWHAGFSTDKAEETESLVGPVVGSIIGGMVFIGISILLGCWLQRPRQTAKEDNFIDDAFELAVMAPSRSSAEHEPEPQPDDGAGPQASPEQFFDTSILNAAQPSDTESDVDVTSESEHLYEPLQGRYGDRSDYTRLVFRESSSAALDGSHDVDNEDEIYVNIDG